MPCIFCRSNLHTKSACSHPNTRVKEEEINGIIQSTYTASQRHNLTRDEFNICIKIILNGKYTVIQLKMSIEDFKKKLNDVSSIDGNKKDLIIILTIMACRFYNYAFVPLSPGHLISPYQLTPGITAVTREILHPQVGNLQPRSNQQINGELQRQRVERSRAYSNIILSQSNRLYNTVQRQEPGWIERVNNGWEERANTNNIPIPFYTTNPPPLITRQYTVHKTEKKCDELMECSVCLNNLDNETYVYLECSHEFCKTCIKGCLTRNLYKCPLCRAPITNVYTQNPIVSYSI